MKTHFRPGRLLGTGVFMSLLSFVLFGSAQAVAVEPLSGITAIASGIQHTCALTSDGGVKCWGLNLYGQLGSSTIGYSTTPVDVQGFAGGVAAIATGGFFTGDTCALTRQSGLKCWGDNSSGQLGSGTKGDGSSAPVDVTGLTSGVIAVSVGGFHTCAVTSLGGVKCWGDNSFGELGDGTSSGPETCHSSLVSSAAVCSMTPVDVIGLASGVSSVAAGYLYTCALMTDGGVKCWGDNERGQLGNGASTGPQQCGPASRTSPCSTSPVDVSGLTSGVTTLSAGGYHACALTTSGGVKCWGSNGYGQLGNGTTTDRNTPVDVNGLTRGVSSVSAGIGHTCVLTNAGGIKCWGNNERGQLGNGANTGPQQCRPSDRPFPCSTTPSDVADLTNGIASVSSGLVSTCARTASGRAECWGDNGVGNLGDGQTCGASVCASPVEVIMPSAGDVNCDGSSNSSDAALILQFAAGLFSHLRCQAAADVNGDGDINSVDALLILQYNAGLIHAL